MVGLRLQTHEDKKRKTKNILMIIKKSSAEVWKAGELIGRGNRCEWLTGKSTEKLTEGEIRNYTLGRIKHKKS